MPTTLRPPDPSLPSPRTAATPGDTPVPAGPTESDVKARFVSEFGPPPDKEAPIDKALGQPTAELQSAVLRAEKVNSTLPRIALPPDEIDGLSGKRQPDLPRAIELFAKGLVRCDRAVRETGINSHMLLSAAARDRAITRNINTGALLMAGGDNGDLLVSALLDQLTTQILSRARARVTDPQLPGPVRGPLAGFYSAAFAAQDAQQQQQQAGAAALSRATAPVKTQISRTDAESADARILDAYLSTVKGKG